MRTVVEPFRSRAPRHLAVIVLMAAGAAGCSSDTTRFSDSPFSNPFASRQAASSEVTGAIPPAAPAPAARVVSQPLPGPQAASPPPRQGKSGGGPGMASYHPQNDVTGSISGPRPASPPAQVPAHTQVAANGAVHVVAPGETLYSLARRYRKSPAAIAQANKLAPDYRLRIGERVVIPGQGPARVQTASPRPAAPAPALRPVAAAAPKPQGAPSEPRSQVAAMQPPASARVATPATEPTIEAASGATSSDTTGATPSFRWPVRGRIIQGFGPKGNGQQNDGINLAVPEGTSVKASEDGVVAYAGNELKGYGNLVLVRHSNGFVTAYAHASEVMVKRGDQVKRGQIIARAGQTGNVTSPQLHFEIRKGATPVDPTQYLGGT